MKRRLPIGIQDFTKIREDVFFPDLNHLIDLTLDPRFADLCGLTQEEVEQNFTPEINGILEDTGKNREEYFSELKQYYNGYRFSKKQVSVYNPFGLLNHFDKEKRNIGEWLVNSDN